MTSQPEKHDGVDILRAVWSADDHSADGLDDDCGPQKTCKNMVGISFDGWAEPGGDLGSAWRDRLEREGKLDTSGQSVRDLVFGASVRADAD